jgi:hypothetical protein
MWYDFPKIIKHRRKVMLDLNVFLSGLLLASSIMTMFIVFYSFSRKTSISIAFAHSFIAIAIYSFGYAMELYSYNLEEMIFWNGFQYLGLPLLGSLWL